MRRIIKQLFCRDINRIDSDLDRHRGGRNDRLTIFLLVFSILCAASLPVFGFFPTSDDRDIYDSVIRLHVLANSDSEYDQQLKLKVRDGILEVAAELSESADNVDEARELLADNLNVITAAAEEVLRREGSDYTVNVTLTRESYPTREYGSLRLPAGEYTSLRVLIGEAEGQNWWCVLFPQLCLAPAVNEAPARSNETVTFNYDDEKLIAAGLTPSQIELITGDSPRVTVRFKLLEFLGELFG